MSPLILFYAGDRMNKIIITLICAILALSVLGSTASAVNKTANKKIDLQKTLKFVEDWSKRDKYDSFPESPSFAYYNLYSIKMLTGEVGPDLRKKVIEYLKSCQVKDGGFSSNPRYDKTANTIFTYYALKTLDLIGALDEIDRKKAVQFVLSLVQTDGSIYAKASDQRASLSTTYYGIASLSLLNAVNKIDARKSVDYIAAHREPGKGYCLVKGGISTPASTFMAVKSLTLLGGITDGIKREVVEYLKTSRYSGRIENRKYGAIPAIEDLSYVLETLTELAAIDVVNQKKLLDFVESLYISENGGFGPEPGLGTTPPSIYHALLCLEKLGAIKR